MKNENIINRLNNVFRDIFDDESIAVDESTTSDDIAGWDSLEHINLILAVETEFGMRFTMGETTGMKNVGEMMKIINSRLTK